MFILAYPGRMYHCVLALLITTLCVDSLTVYGSGNIFLLNMSAQETEGNLHEPPPRSETAKMARYIVHNSGKERYTFSYYKLLEEHLAVNQLSVIKGHYSSIYAFMLVICFDMSLR